MTGQSMDTAIAISAIILCQCDDAVRLALFVSVIQSIITGALALTVIPLR